MKAILVRVAFDSSYGGVLAPIFEDGSFIYMPIPEDHETREEKDYKMFADYLPHDRLSLDTRSWTDLNNKIHFDPEFETFTYGNYGRMVGVLDRLRKGDYIFFTAGLSPYKDEVYNSKKYSVFKRYQSNNIKVCIIGYFRLLENPYIARQGIFREDVKERFRNNAHIKRINCIKDTIILKGCEKESCLLSRAFCISKMVKNSIGSSVYVASDEFEEYGVNGQVQRGFKWLNDADKIRLLLENLREFR